MTSEIKQLSWSTIFLSLTVFGLALPSVQQELYEYYTQYDTEENKMKEKLDEIMDWDSNNTDKKN